MSEFYSCREMARKYFRGLLPLPRVEPRAAWIAELELYLANIENARGPVQPLIKNFTAWELVRPGHMERAEQFGHAYFLPHPNWWPKLGLIACCLQRLRSMLDRPIAVRHVWRPSGYNKGLGSGDYSDHLWCNAVDVRYDSEKSRIYAEEVLREWQKDARTGIRLGIGKRNMHISLRAPVGGKRGKIWYY